MKTYLNELLSARTAAILIVLLAVFAATGGAQTALQGQLAVRALSNDDIGTYKLPSTTERSGGLPTVAVGAATYLDALIDINVPGDQIAGVSWEFTAKPAESKAEFVDSPLTSGVPVYEPSDRLVFQVAGRKMLRADVPGVYTVKATITTVGSGTVTVSRMLTASTYMGIQACSFCHANGPAATPWSMANAWQNTKHSQIFKDGMNGVASDHYSASCLGCHTVGYDTDPNAVNGGFDDVAKAIGWTFPTVLKPGVFDSLPDALKNVGNIQCENCHGPGSTHIRSGGDPRLITKTFDSGVCGQCHGAATHHIKSYEWNNSGHAIAPRDASGAGRESCVGCHTSAGFVGKIQKAATVDTTYNAITCQTCHEPHGETTPSTNLHLVRTLNSVTLADGTKVTNAGMGTLCMNCHQARQNAATYVANTKGSTYYGPHHGPQADMLLGTNGYTYGKKIPSSAHGDVVEETCVACHMQIPDAADPALGKVGGHTFKVTFAGDAKTPQTDLVGTCQGCHGPDLTAVNFALMDYDGDGVIDGVQTEVQHLMDKLALMLPPVGQAKTALTIDATWTQPQLAAAYNYLFVQSDGSRGIHNTAYTVGLLKTSIANLQSQK